jgi:hypothetical protein
MFGGEVFVRDEGFPHNTTPMSEGVLQYKAGGEGFVRDEGFPHNTTPMSEGVLQYKAGGEGFHCDEISGYYGVGTHKTY